jgi:hypothetical protein
MSLQATTVDPLIFILILNRSRSVDRRKETSDERHHEWKPATVAISRGSRQVARQ